MNKFYGKVGFAINTNSEEDPDAYMDTIVERAYYGDILRNSHRYSQGSTLSGDLTISNQFSIISDPFANEHSDAMRYIVYNSTKWAITDVDISQYPRLIVSVGGKYNG